MGSYGIGVTRFLAASIEQYHDDKGIVWPKNIAPFAVHLLTLNESEELTKTAEDLQTQLEAAGLEVIWDDRNERAGVKFNDADLLGVPIQVVVSERNLKEGSVEVKVRSTGEKKQFKVKSAVQDIKALYESL